MNLGAPLGIRKASRTLNWVVVLDILMFNHYVFLFGMI